MSRKVTYLHSHSALERELKYPKHTVIIDEKYADMFKESVPFTMGKVRYCKVDTAEFARLGGVFKNFST